MNILVTGGAGFIGSNFIKYMLKKYEYTIVNFDLVTYAGNLENLESVVNNPHYNFVKGDICNRDLLKIVFEKYKINIVVNFAAETHVDRSIANPEIFLKSNIAGTQALLDTAKNFWINEENEINFSDKVKFIQISTDEVYGTLGKEGFFTENTALAPNSPYSASKASADMLVRAYHETYGLPVNITRCSNNYGPNQFPEKLIPLMINNALEDKALPVYGDGMQIRDWLYVEDHCRAIDSVLHLGEKGEVYNIGGNNEKYNIEVVRQVLKTLGKNENLISFVKDRLGHDRRYAIDNSKIKRDLGWSPVYTFETGLALTINWYVDNNNWMRRVMSKEYQSYHLQK